MWKYIILLHETNDYVLQVDSEGVQIGEDMSVAYWFKTVEELHEYAKIRCRFKENEYGVTGFYEPIK